MSMQGMPVNPWFEKIPHAAKHLSLCIAATKLFLCPCSATIDNTYASFLVLGRSPRKRNYYPFQYSCLENSMDRGAWQATIHRVTKNQKRQKQLSMHARIVITSSSSSGPVGEVPKCGPMRGALAVRQWTVLSHQVPAWA